MIAELESGSDLFDQATSPPVAAAADVAATNFSLTGVEFSRIFDRANGFRLATAARMSAALPMFTPAVYLPSDPPVRVIDSGFFDSYGVDVAAAWLFSNFDWLRCNTSGVVLVQIRAMGRGEDRTGLRPRADGTFARLLRGYQLVGSVLEGAINAFSAGSMLRNDREVAWLSERFNLRADRKTYSNFFTTVVFESTLLARSHPAEYAGAGAAGQPRWDVSHGAMSWMLTRADFQSIQDGFPLHEPKGISFPLQGPELVKRLQQKLSGPKTTNEEQTPMDEKQRDILNWELERAENFERLKALIGWWQVRHEPGDDAAAPCP
jgi:hypothetical protein